MDRRRLGLAALALVAAACRAGGPQSQRPGACEAVEVDWERVKIPRDAMAYDLAVASAGIWLLHGPLRQRDDETGEWRDDLRVTLLGEGGRALVEHRLRDSIGDPQRPYHYRLASDGERLGVLAAPDSGRAAIVLTIAADGVAQRSPAVAVPPETSALGDSRRLALAADPRGGFVAFDLLGFVRVADTQPAERGAFEGTPFAAAGELPREWALTRTPQGFVMVHRDLDDPPRGLLTVRWFDAEGRALAAAPLDSEAARRPRAIQAQAIGEEVLIAYALGDGDRFARVGAPGVVRAPAAEIRWDRVPPRERLGDLTFVSAHRGGFWLTGQHPRRRSASEVRPRARSGLVWMTAEGVVASHAILNRRPDSGVSEFFPMGDAVVGLSRRVRRSPLRSSRHRFAAWWIQARCAEPGAATSR